MAAIIIISIVMVVLFVLFITFAIILIVDIARKKKQTLVRNIVVTAVSFFMLIVMGIINVVLISLAIYENRDLIIEKGLEAGAHVVSKGLVLTYEGIVANWDKEVLKRLENIDLNIESAGYKIEKENKRYSITVLFNNRNKNSESVSFGDLIGSNYLVVCDGNDVIYGLDPENYQNYYLPQGKTKADFEVIVPKDVALRYLRFVERKVYLPLN